MSDAHSDPFGARLASAVGQHGPLCVGVDPHEYLLEDWGLAQSAIGVHDFGMRVVEACAGEVAIIKPQVAFWERFGSAGYRALEDLISAARSEGLLVLADAKRGDLGTTLAAYSDAWLLPGSPLESDAITVSPYLGFGSLEHPLDLARLHGKGVFVLSATSNPEAHTLQTANLRDGSATVAGSLASDVAARNRLDYADEPVGSIGVVLGATIDLDDLGVDLDALGAEPATPVLAPGFGHQGARVAELRSRFGAAAPMTLVSASRSLLAAGPDGLADAVRAQNAEIREALA
jgi:orotidine-5'-phosphate decarboxylase